MTYLREAPPQPVPAVVSGCLIPESSLELGGGLGECCMVPCAGTRGSRHLKGGY